MADTIPPRVWTVVVDERLDSLQTFDDLDKAMAYLRGYIGTNGSERASVVCTDVANVPSEPADDMGSLDWTGAEQ